MNHNQVHGDGHQFDDNYAVEPAAMSDEQIERRDAMSKSKWYVAERYSGNIVSIRAEDESKLIADAHVNGGDESIAQLIASAPDLLAERDALRAVLREILPRFQNMYSRLGGWVANDTCDALIERAQKLLAGG